MEESPPEPARSVSAWVYISCFGVFVALIHQSYVSFLFENDRNFNYLSTLEREMSLRTEMGFYYSYYKTIVTERHFVSGLNKLMYDNIVEYPNEVNAFNRFNIHPEVAVGALYRYLEPWIESKKECHIIDRGDDLPKVESCVGIGDPMCFYMEIIWLLSGLTVAVIFFYSCSLSGYIIGGIISVFQYYANHSECTRVMWTPNERENFAQPFLLMQMWVVTLQLRQKPENKTKSTALGLQVVMFFLNCICLLFWQFSQFIFLTQIAIFFVMEQLRIIDVKTLCIFLHGHFCGLHLALILLQGNDMLKSSLYESFFAMVSAYVLFLSYLRIKIKTRLDLFLETWSCVLRIGLVIFASLWAKKLICLFLDINDDTHIFDIFYSKFTSFKSFHTMLYTCSPVFDFLPFSVFYKLSVTGLIPLVFVGVSNVFCYAIYKALLAVGFDVASKARKNEKKKQIARNESNNFKDSENSVKENSSKNLKEDTDKIDDQLVLFMRNLSIDPGIFYNVAQMLVFGFMAVIVMRLKLLFVPQMCVVCGLVGNNTYYSRFVKRYKLYIFLVLLPVIVFCFTKSLDNYREEASHIGQFNDIPMEELITWINNKTSASAVFAGSMPLMATVMLTTRRPIVNHPHYEHFESRQRTYAVYKTYGRFSPLELYEGLTKLKVTHLIVEKNYCFRRSRLGCSFEEIWDHEVPSLKTNPRLCVRLLTEDIEHYYPVFENDHYMVLRVHDISVRYTPKLLDT